MEDVETLSETVANRWIEFSDHVRKRDFLAAADYLSDDFLGTRFAELPVESEEKLHLDTKRTLFDVQPAIREPADRADFLKSLELRLAALESIDYVFFKTRGAEFNVGRDRGLLRMTVNVIGRGENSAPVSLYGWLQGETVLRAGEWRLRRLILEKLQVTERSRPVFTDVAVTAGLSVVGERLGRGKNTSFYWRGAATGDVDEDGRFDLFTSTAERCYLWRNRGDGSFEDTTDRSGIAAPANVTGCLFLDYDRDGHQDLFLAYVGWEVDGVPNGHSLRLYRGDGKGKFRDVSAETGVGDVHLIAFSACAADIDNDGWLDIFVSGYNRLDSVYPDSWYRARNGTPNVLLRNQGGQRFVDVAEASGVRGQDWTYAAAFADFDEDGDQDLYVANDYGDNRLYRNRGDGVFDDVAAQFGVLDTGNGMGATWGDLDGDGRLDLYVSNMASSAGNRILKRLGKRGSPAEGYNSSAEGSSSSGKVPLAKPTDAEETLLKLAAGNSIFRRGNEGFERVPASAGGIGASWAWSASILDIDLDGTQDIYVTNGFISGDSLKDT